MYVQSMIRHRTRENCADNIPTIINVIYIVNKTGNVTGEWLGLTCYGYEHYNPCLLNTSGCHWQEPLSVDGVMF